MKERTPCFGKIIHGDRPEECSGCPLGEIMEEYTDLVAKRLNRIAIAGPNVLETLQDIHDISQEDGNSAQHVAKDTLGEVRKEVLDFVSERKVFPDPRLFRDCPNF